MVDKRKFSTKKENIYILKNKKLRAKIIQLHYNVPVAEYRGRWKTTELVMRNYWWSGVTRDIEQYVEEYNMC